MRRHWYRPSFWHWWWQVRASRNLKALLLLTGGVLGGLAGYAAAAGSFASSHAAGVVAVTTIRSVDVTRNPFTVTKLVTVHAQSRVIRKLLPVIRTVTVTPAFRPPPPKTVTLERDRTVGTAPVATRTQIETLVVNHQQTVTTRQVVTSQQMIAAEANTMTQVLTQTVPVTTTVPQPVTTTVPQLVTVTRLTPVTQTVPVVTLTVTVVTVTVTVIPRK